MARKEPAYGISLPKSEWEELGRIARVLGSSRTQVIIKYAMPLIAHTARQDMIRAVAEKKRRFMAWREATAPVEPTE